MNLITNSWIPTDTGNRTPAEILHKGSVPTWGRGDWDMATRQFLIGLLQTAVVRDVLLCPDEDVWEDYLEEMPDVSAWLEPFLPYFDNPFEDSTVIGDPVPVSVLLPEAPGENTTKKAADITAWSEDMPKRFTMEQMSIAIYSDQQWGTAIGAGHRLGPRGGAAMTTLVEPAQSASLWEQVWLNVLPHDRWVARFGDRQWDSGQVFPWTAPMRKTATPQDTHPAAIFWLMPRRYRVSGDALYRQNKGCEAIGWSHPLCPYITSERGTFPARISAGHLGYQDWAGISTLGRRNWKPASVVSEFIERRWTGGALRLRVGGWTSVDKAAAAWVEQTVPMLVGVDPVIVENLLDIVEKQRKKLRKALTNVMPSSGYIPDMTIYPKTEALFFNNIQNNTEEGWELFVRRVGRDIYDETVEQRLLDPVVVAQQRLKLR